MASKFLSRLNLGNPIPSEPGSPLVPDVMDDLDENGVACVVIVGEHNLQDEINSAFKDTLIYNVIDKVAFGEIPPLEPPVGSYVDVASLPSDIIEAHNTVKRAEALFNAMPPSVQNRYKNDINQFMADATKDFSRIWDLVKPEPEAIPTPKESEVE